MLIIADHRLPREAQDKLRQLGDFLPFYGTAAYEAISSHPDVYLCAMHDQVIVAPNAPKTLFESLEKNGISWKKGYNSVGIKYPETALYNAVATEHLLIANKHFSDKRILQSTGSRTFVHVNQAYVRCNLLMLGNQFAITSDHGIFKALSPYCRLLEISPKGIQLPGFAHGFLGGCMGACNNQVFISGSLWHHPEGIKLKTFINQAGFDVEELFDGPLLDVGGIFFFNDHHDK